MRRVEVWVVPLDVDAAPFAPLLSSAERARAERYRFGDHARRFTVRRGRLRQILGAELGVPPAEVIFSIGPAGKPALASGGPCFNTSHAGELAVIAVADFEVGIDVEQLDGGPAALDAARVACTPAELARLDALAPADRPAAFLRIWTAKEAYLKALGAGLTTAPDTFDADVPNWCIRPFTPAPGYVGAVAADRPFEMSAGTRHETGRCGEIAPA